MPQGPDIAPGRLTDAELALNFSDAHPPLTHAQAVVEADRCFYCYDAPCIEACPTGIDIPRFIRAIATDNMAGSARVILESNILGGSCARVCPTEILCEQKCVHNTREEGQPIRIGMLQRHATDWQMEHGGQPFTRAPSTGKRVAIVGAGPAGLACAHRLAMHGHDVMIFDRHALAGGLNEYGVAAYKLADDFAQREVDFLLAIGGISFAGSEVLGRDMTVAGLRREYDAVFLAVGLAGVRSLGIEGEDLDGVMDAVDFIEGLRSTSKQTVPVGRRVVVIGGGNTAVDAAVQARRLGADEVTLVYRRGAENMSATPVEREWAQTNGVTVRLWASPVRLVARDGALAGIEFARGAKGADGRATYDAQDTFIQEADMVLKAVGQTFLPDPLNGESIAIAGGRIVVDENGETTMPGVYAGGDCTPGEDLTVAAVRDGRNAAEAIHAAFTAAVAK
ncbi:dihydropyrimidine dehydrogenase [Komagataeibacter rhaeticus]|uniref:NAD(P)-dependent oxidoreductase n=1 Tax=Komagataeibacter rhaeticus TaxID=215221 RepID=A0A181CA59_9PROT|nr:NAD(P)-dependent oxidoreductase [Komagataeibacter rhaeticus]ATU73008.1 dihydropyrimidine dehydrogenase [Komagataeibacter xylinus]MBL7238955.1 NAD(P)-dependent oxidoreductase [Komagataeibacter rhaeticus]PYD54230.1 dihydropyrimidine dehydrogenase [Komagataeibacter rhaeticus]QIP35247.1 NAD(P)-dependent oxidoreductase [Komagataeibacter rhaeticus]QOC47811.1 NAD(P)-dependent oxidoreductase [Komagataeibacter rhaeticus]